jgi:hypothetical protein
VWGELYPSSHENQRPACATSKPPASALSRITSGVADQSTAPLSKPGLASNCSAGQLPTAEFTVQVKLADPLAPVESVALTVTRSAPAVVGAPDIRPEELIESPAGRPVEENVRLAPPESVADICRLTDDPTVVVWLPGLVTVTVLPVGPVEPPPHRAAGSDAPFGVPRPDAMSYPDPAG